MTEKIIDRIRKMLAIANDLAATEQERDTALQMAYKTMAKYNLDMATIEQKDQPEPRGGYDFDGFSFPFAKSVCNSIADLFFCYYIIGHKINGTQCKHHFVGKESNALTAMVMADYIVKSILKEGRKLYKQNTSPECRSFCLGAADRLRYRVRELKAKAAEMSGGSAPGTALVLANMYLTEHTENEKTALAIFDIKTSKTRASSIPDGNAYYQGQDYGNNINLSLQVGADVPKSRPQLK